MKVTRREGAAQQAMELAVQAMPELVILRDHVADEARFLNARVRDLLGYEVRDSEPAPLLRSWVAAEDRWRFDELAKNLAVIDVGEQVQGRVRLLRRDGAIIRCRATQTLLEKDEAGHPLQSLLVFADTTERDNVLLALERKSHELESFLRAHSDAFLRLDAQGAVTYCHPGTWRHGRWTAGAVTGRHVSLVLPADVVSIVQDLLRRAEETYQPCAEELLFLDRPEDSFEIRVLPLLRREKVIVLRDLSLRAQAARQLEDRHAKTLETVKLAELGRIAGAMAHEINSPLTVVSIGAGLIQEHLQSNQVPDRAFIAEEIASMAAANRKVADLVKRLRVFARDERNLPPVAVSVRTLIDDTLALCATQLSRHGVIVHVALDQAAPKVLVRPGQVGQILMSLLLNAFDAVVDTPTKLVDIEVSSAADLVAIAVADSGPPIAPEVRDRLFTLFFTTKDVGEGTGLGLGAARRLAEDQRGTLTFDASAPRTRFVLTLPAAPA